MVVVDRRPEILCRSLLSESLLRFVALLVAAEISVQVNIRCCLEGTLLSEGVTNAIVLVVAAKNGCRMFQLN